MAASNSTASPPDSSSQPPPTPAAPPAENNSSSSSSAPPPSSSPPSPPQPNSAPLESPPSEDKGSSESPSKKLPPPPRDGNLHDDNSKPAPPQKWNESRTGTVYSLEHPKSLSQDSPHSLGESEEKGESRSRRSSKSHPAEASLGLVIGVAVGIGLFLVLMAFGLLIYIRKKKRAQTHHSYYDYPGSVKGGGYYNGDRSIPRWQGAAEGLAPPHQGGGGGWYMEPHSPMIMMIISGEMSTGAFSSPWGSQLPPISPLGFSQFTFSYEELAEATDGFSQGNLLGQGGFGYVFKGKLPNGKEVAIKQLKAGSGQGESEFRAEIEIITRVHHRHLVSLVGYCIQGQQRLLVYEFVPNKTLDYHLHGKGLRVMDWPTRVKIALGSAKGLAYLHEDCHPRIIHRDIKAANILIDSNFEARVADFGLARPSSDTNTHVSTRVMGTFGYLAPEYASTGKLTEKSDVFSFGVMLLELITGRQPIDMTNMIEDSLVDWARPLLLEALADENFDNLVDPRLENNYNVKEMTRMVASAAACVRHSARKRPKLSQIVRALESDVLLEDLCDEKRPGHSKGPSSSSEDSVSYASKMRQLRKHDPENDDFGSQHGGQK